jgi:hypothetical protein
MEEFTDFAGARSVLAVNSLMTKHALFAVIGFFSLCLSLPAEQPARVAHGHYNGFTLAQLQQLAPPTSGPQFLQPTLFGRLVDDGFPGVATFSSRETFSLATTFNLLGTPPSFLPATVAMESASHTVPAPSGKDSSDYPMELRPNYYVTGEVGFLYGRYTGKFGGDYKEGYIIGEVGNDKIHITVGAAYEDWNGRTFRLGR